MTLQAQCHSTEVRRLLSLMNLIIQTLTLSELALRGAIENLLIIAFILTCNYKIESLNDSFSMHQCGVRIPAKGASIASQMMKRCGSILDGEGDQIRS